MDGVENKDKSIHHITSTKPTNKYWKTIFDNFLDMALSNSYVNDTDNPLDHYNYTVSTIETLGNEGTDHGVQPANNPARS